MEKNNNSPDEKRLSGGKSFLEVNQKKASKKVLISIRLIDEISIDLSSGEIFGAEKKFFRARKLAKETRRLPQFYNQLKKNNLHEFFENKLFPYELMGNFSKTELSITIEKLLSSFSSEEIYQLISEDKISWQQIENHVPNLNGTNHDIQYLKFLMLLIFAESGGRSKHSKNFERRNKVIKNFLNKNTLGQESVLRTSISDKKFKKENIKPREKNTKLTSRLDSEYEFLNCLFDKLIDLKLLLDNLILSGFFRDAEFLLSSAKESLSEPEVNFYETYIKFKLRKYSEVLRIIKSKNLVDSPNTSLSRFFLNLFKMCNEKV